jgi:inhibitor of KinA
MKPSYQILSPVIGELVWHQSPSDELLRFQIAYLAQIKLQYSSGLVEVRQGFTRLSLVWKNYLIQQKFAQSFTKIQLNPMDLPTIIWQVPVCYDLEFGQDLSSFAESKNLSLDEVIQLHSAPIYRIHFFGFLPGFFYLNGLSSQLRAPRKNTPSFAVPPGSVAIGGNQTGVYPMQSPGGWHIIGRSPLTFFDPKQPVPVWAKPGEQIQFVPITASQFQNWRDPYPNPIQK